ncbi:methyl-accepting chemotaxis protein [Ningiella sp. W23]|uniref:methyl-accepting chemotaxis protein n=1 Tax=Ningiella sp. W23 TaxID=3023715 RepID=UPI003757A7B5
MLGFLNKADLVNVVGEKGTLRRQLMQTFLVVGMVPLLAIGIIALWLSSSMATNMVSQNLEALKANKVVSIEKYGSTIVNQVITASDDPNLAINLESITQAFYQVVDESLKSDALASSGDVKPQLDRLKSELSRYYNAEFLPQYQSINNGDSVDTNALINSLNPEAVVLQHAYIEKNPAALGNKHEMYRSALDSDYDKAHELIHLTFKEYLEKFSYYDIFLVDTQGYVVYSVYKELDYATNLINGAYASSGLGQAFQASLNIPNANEHVLIDYAQYTPSYEAPASFIASPIFKDGVRLGSLIFQMPLDIITDVMSERRGLGETGESYLVGQDKLMRSDSHKFPDEYSVDASFRNQNSVDTEAVNLALKGEGGVLEIENYKGESVLSGYIPVKFGSLDWALIAEMETDEAYAAASRLRWIILAIGLLVVVAIVFIAMKVTKRILEPVEDMKAAITSISSDTDFSRRVKVTREDEIGESATSLNTLFAHLEVSIKETNDTVTAMANGDFEKRVQSDFKGNLLTLKEGVNASAQAMEDSVKEVTKVVDALAQGDFSQKINREMNGDFARLKDGVNHSAQAIASAIGHISQLTSAMSAGDFTYRIKADLVGEYKALGQQADSAMTSVDGALREIDSVMASVAKGELSARVNAHLPGQLDDIKVKLNGSIDAITDVFSETERVLEALSQGKLNQSITTDFPGRFNLLKTNTNATVEKLTEVVHEIQQASVTVSAGAEDIASGNSSLSARTEQQASNLEQTAASMDEITSTVKHTADNAGHANAIVTKAKEQAQHGGQVVKQAVNAMEEINSSSSKIGDIISVIDSIAFQTNLLALNAAVEAARAGEQGRGFAVVASEVRNLAGRSANAAKEIKRLIEDSLSKVEAGSELVHKSGITLEEIIKQVENVSSIVGEISTAAGEQSTGIDEIHRAIESLQLLTQQNTAMVEEAAAASEELGSQAKGMSELMEFFDTDTHSIITPLAKAS